MKMPVKPILTASFVAASVITNLAPVVAQEVDRDTLCRKFPLNSRCQGYDPATKSDKTFKLNRDTFCSKFPLNSKCQRPPLQVFQLNPDRSGEDDEWIRIEKQNNTVKLFHAARVKDGLVSGILNGGLSAVPFPLPFVELNKYDLESHQVTEVSFKSDRCQAESCVITGKDTLDLPEGTDIYAGSFTIRYREKDLERSLVFRVPADLEPETVDTIIVGNP